MAKTAMAPAAPIPHSPAPRRAVRHVPIEERLSVLETRAESTATRADVRGAENRMILWILGTGVALMAVFFAMLSTSTSRTDAAIADVRADSRAMNARMNARMDALDAKIDRLDAKLDARFDALLARQDGLDAKLDRLDAKMDARFDAIMAELREQRSK